MSAGSAFVYHPSLSQHVLRQDHPMRPQRLRYTHDLLAAYGAFQDPSTLVEPRPATNAELASFHTPAYIEAVQRFSMSQDLHDVGRFNFSSTGDNPVFPGIYEAASLSTGASMVAAEMVAAGSVKTAFNISGGLHHAAAGHASGFCVFNDPVVAINYFLDQGMKVAYIDIDAHHGDGVQNAFYDTDTVLTVSTHESGQFLFPGTGFANEIGTGKGRGYAVNVPLFPYTGDDAYLWAFTEVVIPLVEAFRPDVLVTQLGIDTHFKDPITHLRLTSKAFGAAVQAFAGMGLPWLALGGGGYDLGAVARCWTLAYGVMSSREWPDAIPSDYAAQYDMHLLQDAEPSPPDKELGEQINRYLQASVETVKRLLFPIHRLS